MMRTRGIILVIGALTWAAVLLQGCSGRDESITAVRIGLTRGALIGLVYIAEEKGFFKHRGLNVSMKDYDTGVLATEALFTDEVDVSTAAEFVMAQKSFGHQDLRTFGQIANAWAMGIVARRDRGIEKIADLRGKRIGLPRGSRSEFFLGRFLKSEDIPFSGVQIVDLVHLPAEEAVFNGSVDAVMMWEPHTTRMVERLGSNAVSWPIQGREDYYFLILTTEAFLRRSPSAAEKMLRALIDAEDFAEKHREEALRIVDTYLKFRAGDAQLVLNKSKLKVGLDQSLLTLMEAEAHWMITNNLTPKKQMPNYFEMIYLKALEAVRPEAVGIIH